MTPDIAFAADNIEDALDSGAVGDQAREHLLSALAELNPERARERRGHDTAFECGRTYRGP